MTRRFTSDELYAIRNYIPIDLLIEKLLQVPVKHTQNRLHFSCPLCAGFQTSILREKNLSRCFDCGKNFNTIEIVMYHMHIGFVESVNRLKQYQAELAKHTRFLEKRKKLHSPAAVGEIIANISPAARENLSGNENPAENKQAISKRIDDLEKRFDTLSSHVEKLSRLILSM
jgi:DNA primase